MDNLHNFFRKPQPVVTALDEPTVADRTAPSSLAKARSTPCYAVQLRHSVVPIEPCSVPLLDIFDVYHLYCDVGIDDGRVRNVLRLGFFKEARTATALRGYLAAYFDAPRVVQVDAAEQVRAVGHKFVALKDVGASGQYAVIELAAPRPLPTKIPRPPLQATPRKTVAASSLWSRLLASLHRWNRQKPALQLPRSALPQP